MSLQVGMEESLTQIYARHKSMVRSLINAVVVNNAAVVSTEDLKQVGAMAIIEAMKNYDASRGSFHSYIRQCVWRALLKEANSFSGVFATDEKIRRRANLLLQLHKEGLDDETIMIRLGVKSKETLLSLRGLVDSRRRHGREGRARGHRERT